MNASALIDQFLDAVWVEQGLSENTLAAYGSDLRIFAQCLKGKPLLEVEGTDISKFLAIRYKQGVGNRSSAVFYRVCGVFTAIRSGENKISIDPTALIESPHIGRPLPASLSELDVERLLDAPEVSNDLGYRTKPCWKCFMRRDFEFRNWLVKFEQVGFRQGWSGLPAKAIKSG